MKRFLVLDFVSNNQSMTNSGLARLIMTQHGIALAQTFLVVRQDQSNVAHELAGLGAVDVVQTTAEAGRFDAIPVVRSLVQRLRTQLVPGQTVLVVSYSGPVRGTVVSEGGGQVEANSYRDYLPATVFAGGSFHGRSFPGMGRVVDASGFTAVAPPKPDSVVWRFSSFCSLEEALDSMVQALAKDGFDSPQRTMAMPNLRPLVANTDRRFDGNSVATGTSGMMSELVAAAHARGLIGVASNINGTRFIWLQPGVKRNVTMPHAVEAAAKTVDAPSTPMVGHSGTERPPTPSNPSGGTNTTPATTTEDKLHHRSRRLEQALHVAKFGPYTTGRLAMYDAIEALVREQPEIIFSHLLSEAKRTASETVKRISSEVETGDDCNGQSWRKIGNFVELLLTQADAALDASGQPIGRGIRARRAPVHKLADTWSICADGQILLRMADLVQDLGQTDHENLAGILYHSREQDACDKIESILLHLVESGKLREKEVDGRLVYCRPLQSEDVERSNLRIAQ